MKGLDLRGLQLEVMKSAGQPLYLLLDQDPYLTNEATGVLRSEVLKAKGRDFNYDVFYGGQDAPSRVREAVETLPVMSAKRLIILKEAQYLKEKDWELLAPLFENPVETSCFVIVIDKVDQRKKLFKQLTQKACVVQLKPPFENQLPTWIHYIGQRLELELSSDVVGMIQQLIGTNLYEISSELRKLRDFILPRTKVEAEDVLKLVSRTRVDSVFDLARAIGSRDRVQALTSLAQLLEEGQNEIGTLALIHRHFKILAALKRGAERGLKGAQLGVVAGISPYFLKEYLDQLPAWSDLKLELAFNALREADRALKSVSLPSHILLEDFIIKSCSR